MMKMLWKVFKSIFSIFLSILWLLRRMVCRRRKLSTSDDVELTSVGTGSMLSGESTFAEQEEEAEIEMESWDSWGVQQNTSQSNQSQGNFYHSPQKAESNIYKHEGEQTPNGYGSQKGIGRSTIQNYYYNQKKAEPEAEPAINYFEDMTPEVRRQAKVLIRKKETGPPPATVSLTNRLAVMSDIPPQFQTSELGAWDDDNNAWDNGEAAEDLTWQAEEAIREKKRLERLERQMEQQKRKQKKEESRGIKSGSLVATKIS